MSEVAFGYRDSLSADERMRGSATAPGKRLLVMQFRGQAGDDSFRKEE
jgi:hypothetical protein